MSPPVLHVDFKNHARHVFFKIEARLNSMVDLCMSFYTLFDAMNSFFFHISVGRGYFLLSSCALK